MAKFDDFIASLFSGSGNGKGQGASVEQFADFTKYYNDKFEVLVFDKDLRLIVKDKRISHKTIIYNNINIARANLGSVAA